MNSERTVLVTGFGPFQNHEINASWEAVKELHKLKDHLRNEYNVNLVIDHLPVIYDHVSQRIPQLWKEHDPQLVLHVGVSHLAKCLTIEDRANGTGYVKKDITTACPTGKCQDFPACLETKIDVNELCRKINNKNINDDYKACVSDNAGRYLCEYVYYQSLCQNPERTLFIHVPDFSIYPSEITAKGLYDIIRFLVE